MTVVHTRASGFSADARGTQAHPRRRMTEREFVAWAGEKTRAEWVDGEIIMMAPASSGHDSLGGWVRALLHLYVEHRELGSVFGPELMVRLPRLRRRRLPDVMFLSAGHLDRVRPNHVEGAPDLIMEIVSPDSRARDWRDKFIDYERAGVREYWVLDPMAGQLEAYSLSRGGRYERIPERAGKIPSAVVKGFYLRTQWLGEQRRPKLAGALRDMAAKG